MVGLVWFRSEIGSLYVAQAGLNPLTAFCLCFPSAKTPGGHHHAQLRGEVENSLQYIISHS